MMSRITSPSYLLVLFLPMIFAASDVLAAGNILRVPQDYATIQAAINAAVTGDTVLVSRGTYAGGLLIEGKSITLASNFINTRDPADVSQTILSGGSPAINIQATAAGTTVQGFTIQNSSNALTTYASSMYALDNRFIHCSDSVSFETGGGVVRGNYFADSGDDSIDSDHSSADVTIENNTILNSSDDGIEVRLQSYTGPMINFVIRNNYISGSREDGIQLIDYAGASNRDFRIERNVIVNNVMAGIGTMADGNTVENFNGAPMVEEVEVVNNTISGNPYGITGGDTMLVMNNIIANSSQIGVKRVSASSLATYNNFWNNGTDSTGSNVDTGTNLHRDPTLDPNYNLLPASPCIDAGEDQLVWYDETVYAPAYSGPAPDFGGRETPGGGGPGQASADEGMTADRGPGESVTVRYAPACGALDHVIYWGTGPLSGGISWTGAACRLGTSGAASFDPGTVASGSLIYFVVVAQDGSKEGSYGRDSAGTELPEATGIGSCDLPRSLAGCQGSP
jgi:hypothetical protein